MKNKLKTKLLSLALTAALIVSFAGCGTNSTTGTATSNEKNYTATGTILLSVNPEIEVEYDANGLVIEIEGRNDDGKTIITNYEDFEGKACTEVVSELVQKIYDGGYFANQVDGHDKNIVIKLEDGSTCPNDDFLEEVAAGVRKTVSEYGVKSNAMVVDNDDLDDQGRIGIEKAREIVLAQLGLTNGTFSEGEYDLDDGVYELEFVVDNIEYEYEVDAVTGKVLEADQEHNDDWAAWNEDDDRDDADDMDDDQDDDDRDDADDMDDDQDDDDRDDADDIDDDQDDDRDDADDIDDDQDDDDRDDADDIDDDQDDDDRDDTDDMDDDQDDND